MNVAFLLGAGAGYAGCLWLVARGIARQRTLVLGQLPGWIVVLCAVAALAAHEFLSANTALLVASSFIGAVICALVDARTGYIFDGLSIVMIGVASFAAALNGRFFDGAIAVAVVGGGLGALYVLTRRRGIGLGDVKLGSAIALGYGLGAATIAIGAAFVLGAIYAGVMLGLGRAKRTDALRFGPFIAGGAALGFTADILGWCT